MGIRPARDVNLSMSAGIRSALYVSVEYNTLPLQYRLERNA